MGTPRKLPAETEREIAKRYAAGERSTDLAAAFEVNIANIANIVRRQGGTVRRAGRPPAHVEPDELTGGEWRIDPVTRIQRYVRAS